MSSVLPALNLSLNCWQSDKTELFQLSTHSLAEYSLPKVTKITPSSEYLNGKLFWAKGSRMSLMFLLKRVFLGLTHGIKNAPSPSICKTVLAVYVVLSFIQIWIHELWYFPVESSFGYFIDNQFRETFRKIEESNLNIMSFVYVNSDLFNSIRVCVLGRKITAMCRLCVWDILVLFKKTGFLQPSTQFERTSKSGDQTDWHMIEITQRKDFHKQMIFIAEFKNSSKTQYLKNSSML